MHGFAHRTIDLKVGRQAITWGVNTLFPSLDVFAPYIPTQIDRDYKVGVDAVRLIVSPTSHIEVEAVGAQLEPGHIEPSAAGAMVRINTGAIDFGIMGGSFHDDTRAGGFAEHQRGGHRTEGRSVAHDAG